MHLTEKAIAKIKEFAESEGLNPSVRIKVLGSGCAGFTYDMEFSEPTDDDEVIEISSIKIFCDQLSFQYVDGVMVDFIESQFESGFKFMGGEIKSTCACGSSYSF